MLQGAQIEFVNNRYVFFIGGTIFTNGDNSKKGIWNTVSEIRFNSTDEMNNMINDIRTRTANDQDSYQATFCDKASRMMHIQQFNRWDPIKIEPSELIIFDFINREWKSLKNIATIKNSLKIKMDSVTIIAHPNALNGDADPNKRDVISHIDMFGHLSQFKSRDFGLCRDHDDIGSKSIHHIKLSFETSSWIVERVIWIGYLKNESNCQCLWPTVPKDVVKYFEIDKIFYF